VFMDFDVQQDGKGKLRSQPVRERKGWGRTSQPRRGGKTPRIHDVSREGGKSRDSWGHLLKQTGGSSDKKQTRGMPESMRRGNRERGGEGARRKKSGRFPPVLFVGGEWTRWGKGKGAIPPRKRAQRDQKGVRKPCSADYVREKMTGCEYVGKRKKDWTETEREASRGTCL